MPEERALISSVFHNRLDSPDFEKRRYLQSDPTSAYACYAEPERVPACQGFSGKVTPALNRDPANRYSTYVVQGLPPGPIANPGEAAIEAAVAPAKTDYLFFVARGGGRHHFSRTYAEHQRAGFVVPRVDVVLAVRRVAVRRERCPPEQPSFRATECASAMR